MQDRHPLRIGCVKYLNARPLIHGWLTDVVLDHPSALCVQLSRGELDIALVSSFEFLRNPIYRIVDGISISSDGPVYSVVVAHVGEISDVKEIELDPAAETSGNLLRCLLNERKLSLRFVATSIRKNSSFGTSANNGKNWLAFRSFTRFGSFDLKLSIQNRSRVGYADCATVTSRTSTA